MLQQAEKPTPEALLGGSDDPAAEDDEQRSRICCCERPSTASLCPHARFEPPPRPGLPDADPPGWHGSRIEGSFAGKGMAQRCEPDSSMVQVAFGWCGDDGGGLGCHRQSRAGPGLCQRRVMSGFGGQRELSPNAPAQADANEPSNACLTLRTSEQEANVLFVLEPTARTSCSL